MDHGKSKTRKGKFPPYAVWDVEFRRLVVPNADDWAALLLEMKELATSEDNVEVV